MPKNTAVLFSTWKLPFVEKNKLPHLLVLGSSCSALLRVLPCAYADCPAVFVQFGCWPRGLMLVLVGRSTNDGASVQEDATTDGKLAAAAIEAVFV